MAGVGAGAEVCIEMKGDIPEPIEPPTLTITDIESITENETAALEATLMGGSYDTAEYSWEVVSGGGTLSTAPE